MILHLQNASEIIYPGCPKFKTYLVFVCTGRVYDFDVFQILNTVKPVLSGHRIKRTPSIKRTVAEVPKFISSIYFK